MELRFTRCALGSCGRAALPMTHASGLSDSEQTAVEYGKMTKAEIGSWQRGVGRRLLERVGAAAGQAVLDFGCREGNYAEVAAQIVGPTGGVYALDKNRVPLGKLASSISEQRVRNIVPVCTSDDALLPLTSASVDLVLLYDVIHLIGRSDGQSGQTAKPSTASARRVLLRELFRVLRSDGTVSVYCPHLTTHTDVKTEQDIVRELEGEGFVLKNDFHTPLVHDATLVSGHIMNFAKDSGHARHRWLRPLVRFFAWWFAFFTFLGPVSVCPICGQPGCAGGAAGAGVFGGVLAVSVSGLRGIRKVFRKRRTCQEGV